MDTITNWSLIRPSTPLRPRRWLSGSAQASSLV